jgi:hypothetical protein
VLETSGPISSIFTTEDNQTLYTVNGFSGEVAAYGSKENGAFRSLGTSEGLVSRNSRGNLVRVGDGKVAILNSQGKQLSAFATPPPSHTPYSATGVSSSPRRVTDISFTCSTRTANW